MQITLNINKKEKTYNLTTIKARMLRKSLELTNEVDFNNLKPTDLDKLIGFVCDCFEKQFTIDDLYDGLEGKDLIPTIMNVIAFVNGSFAEEVKK